MSATKKPYIHELRCMVLADTAFVVRCPACHQPITLGDVSRHSAGFRFESDGMVREDVVCLNLTGTNLYCDWSGRVRLHKQVHTLQEL